MQSLHVLILFDHRDQSSVELLDVFLQTLDTPQLVLDAGHQHTGQCAMFLGFGQFTLNALQQNAMALGQHHAEFVQQTTQPVGLHDAHLHELGTQAMQDEAGLLLFTFDRHWLDVELLSGYSDGLRITGIGLVTQDKGIDMLGGQQLHFMP